MRDEVEHLAGRMAKDGEKTLDYFRQLPEEAWPAQVYTTGSAWGVKQVLAHFVSAERWLKVLIEDVVNGGEGAPRALDIDDFNEEQVPQLEDLRAGELLAAFEQARHRSVELTSSLSADDLAKVGYHPWFGEVPIRDMLKLVYRHNMIHLRDVRKALRSGKPVPHREIEPPSASG